MSGLRVDLLTQSGDYPEPVRGLKVFCRRVRLLWVFLKVEKKTGLIRLFLPVGFDPTIPGLDLLLLYQLSYEAWQKQIVAGFVIL